MNCGRDQELVDLWGRCSGRDPDRIPTDADWRQLYVLVRGVLERCNAPELSRLSGERADYIDEYFSEKVFLPMRPGLRGPDHCGALVVFFRRYLRTLAGSKAGASESVSPPEPTEPPDPPVSPTFRDVDRILREDCGRTADQVSEAAIAFLSSLTTDRYWASVMLRHNFCPDDEHRIPLQTLAHQHQIPSYHYRAGRLGINHQWHAGLGVFRGTIVGQWLEETLGAPISAEKSESVGAALEILCFHALRQ